MRRLLSHLGVQQGIFEEQEANEASKDAEQICEDGGGCVGALRQHETGVQIQGTVQRDGQRAVVRSTSAKCGQIASARPVDALEAVG